jgi:hypothetical protein
MSTFIFKVVVEQPEGDADEVDDDQIIAELESSLPNEITIEDPDLDLPPTLDLDWTYIGGPAVVTE